MQNADDCIGPFDGENNALASVQPQEEKGKKRMATSSSDEEVEETQPPLDSSEISEVEVLEHFDSFGVPSDIKHCDHIGKFKVWNQYRQLRTMIRVTKYARTKYYTKVKPKEMTHLC